MVNVDGNWLKLKAALRFRVIGKQMHMFRVMKIKQSMKFSKILTLFQDCFAVPYVWNALNIHVQTKCYLILSYYGKKVAK